MFDIHRWADWASQQTSALRAQGFDASFTFAEGSSCFFVDLDKDSTLGRIIFWSTGAVDMSVHRNSREPLPIRDLPAKVTDTNFEAIFDRFVETVNR